MFYFYLSMKYIFVNHILKYYKNLLESTMADVGLNLMILRILDEKGMEIENPELYHKYKNMCLSNEFSYKRDGDIVMDRAYFIRNFPGRSKVDYFIWPFYEAGINRDLAQMLEDHYIEINPDWARVIGGNILGRKDDIVMNNHAILDEEYVNFESQINAKRAEIYGDYDDKTIPEDLKTKWQEYCDVMNQKFTLAFINRMVNKNKKRSNELITEEKDTVIV